MTHYLGFIARPIVRIYAVNEVVACGIREPDGRVSILFAPDFSHKDHEVFVSKNWKWRNAPFHYGANYSHPYVHRAVLSEAKIGERYEMEAVMESGRSVASPSITVKHDTAYDPSLMEVKALPGGGVFFTWERAEDHDPLIYFFVLEDEKRETYAAIYTREHFWTYPKIKKASYSVGPSDPPLLTSGEEYTAKLAVVDFDGWVSHLAEQTFSAE